MRTCVITDRKGGFSMPLPQCDIALFPFGALGTVDFSRELSGKSDKLEKMAEYSLKARCGVLCGCVTDSRGLKRKSVAVASEGKLLGISDMVHVLDGEEYKSGAFAGIYAIRGYRAGVCIENDLRFPEYINALATCGCNLICVHCANIADGMPPQLIRAYAYLYGIPFVMSACGTAFFADITGVIASSNREASVFETSSKNCCRLVTTRRRGVGAGAEEDAPPDF